MRTTREGIYSMRLAGNPFVKVFDGRLILGNTPCVDLVKHYKTPFLVFFPDRIKENCEDFTRHVRNAFKHAVVYYSVKTNPVQGILKHVARSGIGAQTININEFNAATRAGFAEHNILIDGVLHDE
nr:hypothetical protein [Candidatus Sigynarchaeota archaeon]